MPKDFDRERRPVVADDQRQFTILGQTFTIRKRVDPEVIVLLDSLSTDAAAGQNIATIDQALLDILVSGDRERWSDLRARKDDDDMIELGDMQGIINWAMETLSTRPLDSASSSGDTPANIAPPSRGLVSQLEAVPSTG